MLLPLLGEAGARFEREDLSVVGASSQVRSGSATGIRIEVGDRAKLDEDIRAGLATSTTPRLMVVFDVHGLKRHTDSFGRSASEALVSLLTDGVAAIVGSSGSCYRLRGVEFCVLVDDPGAGRSTLLDDLAAALRIEVDGTTIEPVLGAVVLPREAAHAGDALLLADTRLNLHRQAKGLEPERSFDSVRA